MTLQTNFAELFGGNYGALMALVTAVVAFAVAGFAGFGPQAKEVRFTAEPATAIPPSECQMTNDRSAIGVTICHLSSVPAAAESLMRLRRLSRRTLHAPVS